MTHPSSPSPAPSDGGRDPADAAPTGGHPSAAAPAEAGDGSRDPFPAQATEGTQGPDATAAGPGSGPAAGTEGRAGPEAPHGSEAPEGREGGATRAPGDSREALLHLALSDLRQRRQELLRQVRELEQRRDQIQREITSTFGGQSDAIARRLRGFQEYLVGALQDLAATADSIDLVAQPVVVQPSPLDQAVAAEPPPEAPAAGAGGLFGGDAELIEEQLKRFQGQPDFYADPWKLRRTLEPSAAAVLENWFLAQGGRGAQPSAGSRNRNAVITAAAIAILGEIYGDRFQTLILAGQPERLGEWRRGLQDGLGLTREDFGPTSGIVLFERPEALIERADRLEEGGELPFIVVDAAEGAIPVPILQFPLWLAFAAGPGEISLDDEF